MNVKRSLENYIRGWLPQDASIPSRKSPIHIPKLHKHFQQPLIGIVRFLAIFTAGISLLFAFSSLQTVLVLTLVAFGIFWFVSNRKHNITSK